MRRLALFLALAGTALPALAARHATVEQLEQMLSKTEAKSDAEVARQLSEMELTERLSHSRLVQLSAGMPGEKSRQAMLALADASAFLDPPPSEIPATAMPDAAVQKKMMARTVEYLGKSLPLLPNLVANRDTIRFESRPEPSSGVESSWRAVGRSSVLVVYRENQEFIDAGAEKTGKSKSADRGLMTWGEFGPILGTVTIDAARSKLAWSHWELSPSGPVAVFRYAVPPEKSHYDVRFCCISEQYGFELNELRQKSGYHGEIAVDPDNGAILRMTVIADLDANNPISRASMAVEYAPVEIGGKTYVCPARGVAIAQAPDAKALLAMTSPGGSGSALPPLRKASLPAPPAGGRELLLNDIEFRHYHVFRTEARILSDKEKDEAIHPAPAPSSDAETARNSLAGTMKPAEQAAEENLAAAATPVSQPAQPVEAGAPVSAGAIVSPLTPEIGVEEAAGLPEAPALANSPSQDSGFTFRINSRLVDVNVVAVDKKGRPVTNLKPEDFEVFDDGKKVDIRSFEQAGVVTPEAAPQAVQAAPAAEPGAISNRPTSPAKTPAAQGNTMVLLIDGANLSFFDFADARQQMVRFLRALPEGERVALYTMKYHGFKVLEEDTGDHEKVAAHLAKWVPEAQDMANANDEEQRNRQQIETVHSPEDLLNVNGNGDFNLDPATQSEALDPKLRELGSNPSGNALWTLVDVARHLATLPGHKSLVWVTSDNALADWNKMSVTIEKSSKYIEPAALRVQEAMNNAHVSVYPLDASRLEASVIDVGIGRRNVELTPTFQLPPVVEQALEGPEMAAGKDVNQYGQSRDLRSGRLMAQAQQDMHPIMGIFREIADATGGRTIRRTNNITGQLESVDNDGRATYLLAFSPAQQADNQYHLLTVKVIGHKDVSLRYRTGYEYDRDPASLKERFAKAVWQGGDVSDIKLTATRSALDANMLKLNIAASDLAMAQSGDAWTDKIGVFVVQRDDSGLRAQVSGETLNLKLKPGTYQKLLREGIPFDQVIGQKKESGALRIVVLDENSGRMGTLTVPAATLIAAK